MFEKFKARLVAGGWLEDDGSTKEPGSSEKTDNSKRTAKQPAGNQSITSVELPSAFTTSIGSAAPTEPDQKYVTFVAGELEKLNLSGIDSFELSAAMRKLINKGMPLPTAIQAAYETFASTNSDLTVEKLAGSCDYYLKELQKVLNDFIAEKDNEVVETQKRVQNSISKLEQRATAITSEEEKLNTQLQNLANEKQQNAVEKQKQETELQTAQHDAENRKVHMKLAIVKVSSVIQEDKAAILQHLNQTK